MSWAAGTTWTTLGESGNRGQAWSAVANRTGCEYAASGARRVSDETRQVTGNLRHHGFEFIDDSRKCLTIREMAEGFGEIFKVPTLPLVQTLLPKIDKKEQPNTYSSIFGLGAFPFHSDLAHWQIPPRYILLRCAQPNEQVSTLLMRSRDVLPDHRMLIAKRGLFMPRRRMEHRSFFLRISEPQFWRWDSVFIRPANEVARKLKQVVESSLKTALFEEIRFTAPGQVLIIDNWSMLHARSAIAGESVARSVERVYLSRVD